MTEGLKKVGNYRLIKLIGKGATSQVFEGRKEGQINKYAIKMIQTKGLTPKQKQMITKEVAIIRSIDHPNIVKLFDTLETANNFYLIFEFCENGDLQHYLKDYYGPLIPTRPLQKIIYCIADAIALLHSKGIAHRDIKLANILLKKDCTIKLADFGFARQSIEESMMTSYCGTPITMAPEILQGKVYDKKCDVWSLGIILFQLSYGKLPFSISEGYSTFVEKVINEPLRIPKSPQHGPDLRQLLCKSLEKRSEDRYSIQQFIKNKWVLAGGIQSENKVESVSQILRGASTKGSGSQTMSSESCSESQCSDLEQIVAEDIVELLREQFSKISERHVQNRNNLLKMVQDKQMLLELLCYYDYQFLSMLKNQKMRIRVQGSKQAMLNVVAVKGIEVPQPLRVWQKDSGLQAGNILFNYLRSISIVSVPLQSIKTRYEIVLKMLQVIRSFDLQLTVMFTNNYMHSIVPQHIVHAIMQKRMRTEDCKHPGINHVALIIECKEKDGKMKQMIESLRVLSQKRLDQIQKQLNGY